MPARPSVKEKWTSAEAYEAYVGRWSRALAPRFLAWAGVHDLDLVVDVGSGTGALAAAALAARVREVVGVDLSADYVDTCNRLPGAAGRARFHVGDAQALPLPSGRAAAAVSGLVLNFVPRPAIAVTEMARVVRPGATVAAYVWDYAGRMDMIRAFWDAAIALDPPARSLDEGVRFPLCNLKALAALFRTNGLKAVATTAIDQPTVFASFEDYWAPFLGGQGPAPGYCIGLPEDHRMRLRERLRTTLPTGKDGRIALIARAFAVKGRVPG